MLQVHKAKSNGTIKRVYSNDEEFYVIPVIALVEGVVNESLVTSKAIKKFYESWNGRPVPISHPQVNKQFVSANNPQIISEYVVGNFWNVKAENDKLSGEVWVSVNQAKKVQNGNWLLERIANGDPLEVSTAYWEESEDTPGTWNGKSYNRIVKSMGPDHLAILVNEKGACSWEDGCGGPRVNVDLSKFNDSVMVAFYLDGQLDTSEYLKDLPLNAQIIPNDELHVTSIYLGKVDEIGIEEKQLADIVQNMAYTVPIPAETSYVGRFYKEEAHPIFVGINSKSLIDWRNQLKSSIQDFLLPEGRVINEKYSYTPHVTLAYINPDDEWNAIPLPPVQLAFNKVCLKWGTHKYEFDLKGNLTMEEPIKANSCDCQEENKTETEANLEVNEENMEQQTETQPVVQELPQGMEDIKSLAEAIKEIGTVQEIVGLLSALKTNSDNLRTELIAELTANSSNAFSKSDLDSFSTDSLQKLAQSLRKPDFSGQGGLRSNSRSNDEWESYVEPKGK